MLNIKRFSFNPFSENTYVVWDCDTKECAVIDAGCYYADEEDKLSTYIDDNELNVKYLLATHLHLDHCLGCNFISARYGVKLTADSREQMLLDLMQQQADMFGLKLNKKPLPIGIVIKEGENITIGKYIFSTISVPGHSPGSIVYYCRQEAVAFVGDVIFRESIGRSDLPGGSYKQLSDGIRNKLFSLPDNTTIYSGHGETTTIGYERDYNPYI